MYILRVGIRARSEKGQIVIPALFTIPLLWLFLMLIFEATKLSQQKIRHQFAIDSAAFIEMTNYSDFLNRTAYVDGAFPMRIFHESFVGQNLNCTGRQSAQCSSGGTKPWEDVMYEDGVFPRDNNSPAGYPAGAATPPQWPIEFSQKSPRGQQANSNPPNVSDPNCQQPDCVVLVQKQTAIDWNLEWDDSKSLYTLFYQVYSLLGQVEDAQYSVLERLSQGHHFLTKSYWLNTGGETPLNDLPGSFDASGASDFRVNAYCASNVLFYGNLVTHDWLQPYQIVCTGGGGQNGGNGQAGNCTPIQMPSSTASLPNCSGLFQLASVPDNVTQALASSGWSAEAQWTAPNNYFNIASNNLGDGTGGQPRVRATVLDRGWGAQAAVWPLPTPKFQVRLYP